MILCIECVLIKSWNSSPDHPLQEAQLISGGDALCLECYMRKKKYPNAEREFMRGTLKTGLEELQFRRLKTNGPA